MVVRAVLLAAMVAAMAPAPADAAGAVRVEFVGEIRIGCLGCWDGATISGPATVVGTGGAYGAQFTAQVDEWTTPDLCTSLAQASGTFSVGGITGRLDWFRSHNALTLQASDVDGGGLADGTGGGTAVIAGNPATVTFASCGADETRTFRVAGELVIAG